MTVIRLALLAALVVLLAGPVRAVLARAHWAERVPRSAIALWQAIGAAATIALVGICVLVVRWTVPGPAGRRRVTDLTASEAAQTSHGAMAPEQLFVLTVALIIASLAIGATIIYLLERARAHARQRVLIDILGREHARLPGAIVIPSTKAAAFSLPGLRARIVVSAGVLEVLDSDELAALVAHERVHARARHDLILLPFQGLASLLPRSRAARQARDEVAALVEMAADDRVCRSSEPEILARALCRIALATPARLYPDPSSEAVVHRVERALVGRSRARALAFSSLFVATAVLALPLLALALPLGR